MADEIEELLNHPALQPGVLDHIVTVLFEVDETAIKLGRLSGILGPGVGLPNHELQEQLLKLNHMLQTIREERQRQFRRHGEGAGELFGLRDVAIDECHYCGTDLFLGVEHECDVSGSTVLVDDGEGEVDGDRGRTEAREDSKL